MGSTVMKRNIVLVVLDTVRKDYFDKHAQNISGESSTTFTQCRAAGSWSVPSHTSMFTGDLPHEHDIHAESFGPEFDFGENIRGSTFLSELKNYEKYGISSNLYMNKRFGFDTLFDEFVDNSIGSHWNAVPFPESKTDFELSEVAGIAKWISAATQSLSDDEPIKSVINGLWIKFGDKIEKLPFPKVTDNGARANIESAKRLAELADEPFFTFINFMDAHNPLQNTTFYDQSLHSAPNSWSSNDYTKWELLIDNPNDNEYKRNYRELYGAAIDYLDRTMEDMVAELTEITENETTVIVTADHGHNLGFESEMEYFHHTASLSEGILHVPLEIINPPDDFPKEVTKKFSQTNLPELIMAITRGSWDSNIVDHQPVVAENIGLLGEDNMIDYSGPGNADQSFWNRMIRCGYINEEKFEWDSLGDSQVFKLNPERACWQIRSEVDKPVPDPITRKFDVGLSEYKQYWQNEDQRTDFDGELKENLKDLGYL